MTRFIQKRKINIGPPATIQELNQALKDFDKEHIENIEDQDAVLGKFWDSKLETWEIDDDFWKDS